jgi:hypothetical protein
LVSQTGPGVIDHHTKIRGAPAGPWCARAAEGTGACERGATRWNFSR